MNVEQIFIKMLAWDLLEEANDHESVLINYSVMVRASLSGNISELIQEKISHRLKNKPYTWLFYLHKALERDACMPDFRDTLTKETTRLGECLEGIELTQSSANLITAKNFCYTTALDHNRDQDSGQSLGELKQQVLAMNFEALQKLMTAYREGHFGIDPNSPFAQEEAMRWFVIFSLADFEQEEKAPYMRLFAEKIIESNFQGGANLETFDEMLKCLELTACEDKQCELLLKSLPFCAKEMCIGFLRRGGKDAPECSIQ